MRIRLLLAAALVGMVGVADAPEAAVLTYQTILSGTAEAPPNASPGTGTATLSVDTVAQTFFLEVTFSDLIGFTTAAHIHGPTELPGAGTAGVMTQTPFFVGFPTGVQSGSYSALFDMTLAATFNSGFITSQGSLEQARVSFLAALENGQAYLNIHTTQFPAGEIRGFFAPVPLPAGMILLLSALGIFGAAGARPRKTVPARA